MSRSACGILFVTNSLVPGGAEHVLIELAKGMARRAEGRYRPVVACLKSRGSRADELSDLGVPVYENLLKHKYDWLALGRLMRLMRRERVGVVVAAGSGGDRMFWGTLAGKIVGARTVVWAHLYPQEDLSRLSPLLSRSSFEVSNRAIYRMVDRFVALGTGHRSALAWIEHVPLGKIEMIHNGVDIGRYARPQLRERARSILGLADDQVFAVAMVANLRAEKRHDVFIRAARQVVQRYPNAHFFVIGDGPNKTKVRGWATVSGLLGRNLSLLGQRDDVDQLLPGLDLVCLCSDSEVLSLSALEAMAAGVPVLSNRVGSMDEAIIDGQTGFFYQELKSSVLAAKITELIDSRQLCAEVASCASRLIEEKFSADKMTEQFCRLWDTLLDT